MTKVRSEILQVAKEVAETKGIDAEDILEAMEVAIQKAGRSRYGAEHDIRATIDRNNGKITLAKVTEVVPELLDIEDEVNQITLAEAHAKDKSLKVGDTIIEELPPLDFGRMATQTAKQIILQKVREAERHHQFENFQDKVGQVITAEIKRIDYGNVVLDLGKTEAILRREETIPRERFKVGDKIKTLVLDVREETRGHQVFLSRTHPHFLKALLHEEVPEIADGVIEIKGVSRDPGARAKILVHSEDDFIDPIGTTIGARGSRIQAITSELSGERIDIIKWTDDLAQLVISVLSNVEITRVLIDEVENKVEVVVPDDQLSSAIGRRGQNVRLASQIIGWSIDIINEEEEARRRQDDLNRLSSVFTDALDVDEDIAELIISFGYKTISDLALTTAEELCGIEEFDEITATQIIDRAIAYQQEQESKLIEKLEVLGVEQDLLDFEGLPVEYIVALSEDLQIKSVDDFAELAGYEVVESLGEDKISEEDANKLIMKAREKWFAEEDSETTEDSPASDDAQADS